MSAKAVLVLCAQALLAQCVFSQCTSRAAVDASGIAVPYGRAAPGLAVPSGSALAYNGLAAPFGFNGLSCLGGSRFAGEGMYPAIFSSLEFTPTSGGALPVSSASAVAPTGISIVSENAYEGLLDVIGELSFVGTTTVDGVLPSYGAGAINHGCGNGDNAMSALSATSTPASVATASGFGNGVYAAPGYATTGVAPCNGYYGAPIGGGRAYDDFAYGATVDNLEITPTSGGGLPVSSASAVPPTGIVLNSETAYEGPLAVAGELPFVGTVGVDVIVPSAGVGAVNHACGNGINAMASDTSVLAPGYSSGVYAPAAGIAPVSAVAPGYGYQNGLAGRGYGCAY